MNLFSTKLLLRLQVWNKGHGKNHHYSLYESPAEYPAIYGWVFCDKEVRGCNPPFPSFEEAPPFKVESFIYSDIGLLGKLIKEF